MCEQQVILQQPLSELIAVQLRKKIWNKELLFGERLLETELAEQFDVSRSTIREALRILEIEELVVSKARKGTYVATFSEQDIAEIIELRMIIESRAFVHAVRSMEAEDFQKLERITDEMKKEAEQQNWNKLFDLDMEFHSYVVHLSGNSRIIKIYNSLQVQIRTVLMDLDQYYSSFQSFYDEHVDLLAGLKTKDVHIVKEKVNKHIEFVEEKFLSVAG
ncbi:MAG TPA: GntR family transcriptional regulator [Virgibacillus sp.]|nr:GntR family transcriptional regulator [Virgibacillus sp.]